MFHLGYVLLVLLASVPLIRTLLKGTDGRAPPIFLHRIYRDSAYLAAAVLAIICFETALNISLQNYWFGELGQRYRYWLALGLWLGVFFTVLVSAASASTHSPSRLTRAFNARCCFSSARVAPVRFSWKMPRANIEDQQCRDHQRHKALADRDLHCDRGLEHPRDGRPEMEHDLCHRMDPLLDDRVRAIFQ